MDDYKKITIDGLKYYGKHLILSAKSCNERICDIEGITLFLRTLVNKIDMIPYGDPIVARFCEGIEIGISGVQLISTSAITVHTNDYARDLYLDVFSCKGFNEDTVIEHLHSSFNPISLSYQILLRR